MDRSERFPRLAGTGIKVENARRRAKHFPTRSSSSCCSGRWLRVRCSREARARDAYPICRIASGRRSQGCENRRPSSRIPTAHRHWETARDLWATWRCPTAASSTGASRAPSCSRPRTARTTTGSALHLPRASSTRCNRNSGPDSRPAHLHARPNPTAALITRSARSRRRRRRGCS